MQAKAPAPTRLDSAVEDALQELLGEVALEEVEVAAGEEEGWGGVAPGGDADGAAPSSRAGSKQHQQQVGGEGGDPLAVLGGEEGARLPAAAALAW